MCDSGDNGEDFWQCIEASGKRINVVAFWGYFKYCEDLCGILWIRGAEGGTEKVQWDFGSRG